MKPRSSHGPRWPNPVPARRELPTGRTPTAGTCVLQRRSRRRGVRLVGLPSPSTGDEVPKFQTGDLPASALRPNWRECIRLKKRRLMRYRGLLEPRTALCRNRPQIRQDPDERFLPSADRKNERRTLHMEMQTATLRNFFRIVSIWTLSSPVLARSILRSAPCCWPAINSEMQHRRSAISVVRAASVCLAGESRRRGGRGVRVSVRPHP